MNDLRRSETEQLIKKDINDITEKLETLQVFRKREKFSLVKSKDKLKTEIET
jgi:hypothetical protein